MDEHILWSIGSPTFFVFSLCERKNEIQRKWNYLRQKPYGTGCGIRRPFGPFSTGFWPSHASSSMLILRYPAPQV
jgi:hypothetical protein